MSPKISLVKIFYVVQSKTSRGRKRGLFKTEGLRLTIGSIHERRLTSSLSMNRDGFDWGQMCSTAKELLAVLVGDTTEDIILNNVREMARQITGLRKKQEEQIKNDVKYLCDNTAVSDRVSASDTGDSGETFEDLARKETALLQQVDNLQKKLTGLTGECQNLKEELAKAKSAQKSLREQQQRLREAQAAALPKARCDMNLYSNITNLRWQYQCQPHEVKGYICQNEDIKTFSLDSQQVSRFFIANYLWELIEEDW